MADLFIAADLATMAGAVIIPADRTSSLLDLALDVIAGRVSGLDAERIAALR